MKKSITWEIETTKETAWLTLKKDGSLQLSATGLLDAGDLKDFTSKLYKVSLEIPQELENLNREVPF